MSIVSSCAVSCILRVITVEDATCHFEDCQSLIRIDQSEIQKYSSSATLRFFVQFQSCAFAQEPIGPQPKKARTPADYKLRTLKEIAELGSPIAAERDDDRKGDASTLTHGDLLPSRVRVTYKGVHATRAED